MSEREDDGGKGVMGFLLGLIVGCVLTLGAGGTYAMMQSRRAQAELHEALMREEQARREAEEQRAMAERQRQQLEQQLAKSLLEPLHFPAEAGLTAEELKRLEEGLAKRRKVPGGKPGKEDK